MTNPFENIRAVLFDMDGTLVETNIDFPLMKREMILLAERHGVDRAEVEGRDILSIVDITVSRLRDSRGDEAEVVKQEALDILEHIESAHCAAASPIEGAPELLQALRSAGIKVGIVTRNCRSAVAVSLEKSGIAADVLLTRDDVRDVKPHPEHLLQALRMLEVDPRAALMVGDHWMDIQAGKAAGTRTVGFLRPDRPDGFFDPHEPDLIVSDLAELLDCLMRLKR